MAEASEPKKRGRPPGDGFKVEFDIPKEMAAYLKAVGTPAGWGSSVNMIARSIVMQRAMELQMGGFHNEKLPAVDPSQDA